MRTIERTSQFKRDYKRETKGLHPTTLNSDLMLALVVLASDLPLLLFKIINAGLLFVINNKTRSRLSEHGFIMRRGILSALIAKIRIARAIMRIGFLT